MANRPSKIKIDVTKIDKSHLYKGAKGTYLNCALFENRDGPGQYGDTHFITQEISKEARDRGEKGAIIGNATIEPPFYGSPNRNFSRPPEREQKSEAPAPPAAAEEEDEIPF